MLTLIHSTSLSWTRSNCRFKWFSKSEPNHIWTFCKL